MLTTAGAAGSPIALLLIACLADSRAQRPPLGPTAGLHGDPKNTSAVATKFIHTNQKASPGTSSRVQDLPRELHDLVKQTRKDVLGDIKSRWKEFNSVSDPRTPVSENTTDLLHFGDVVKHMKARWKEHKADQIRELEPWKAKKAEFERTKPTLHRAKRPRPQSPEAQEAERPGGSVIRTITAGETEMLEAEAKKARYGAPIHVVVKDGLGRETPVLFRRQTWLRVLMQTVCNRLDVPSSQAVFLFKDREILPRDTPDSLGMGDQDIIELAGDYMKQVVAEKQDREKRMDVESQFRAKEQNEVRRRQLARSFRQSRRAHAEQAAKTKQEEERRFRRNDMIHLRFISDEAGEVRVGHVRDVRLSGLMSRIARRMGLNADHTHFFRNATGRQMLPADTVSFLGMEDDEVIHVNTVVPVVPDPIEPLQPGENVSTED